MVPHNTAVINGIEQTICITITAIVCFTVLILARDISGAFLLLPLIFCELRGLKFDSELCQISLHIQEYVYTSTKSGIMNMEIQYL